MSISIIDNSSLFYIAVLYQFILLVIVPSVITGASRIMVALLTFMTLSAIYVHGICQ